MNFGTPVPLLVGLILILGAVGLFFLDKLKPGYERSSDKVYSILLLLSGIFLLAHLNMELLASFQQVMLVGMLTTLIISDISKRDSNRVRPAERDGPPRRYEERPRRVYRAELDDWDTPGPGQPRIPSDRYGYDEPYQSRPLEPQRPPYEERRPPARLQPSGQGPGRPPERPGNGYGNNNSYGDGRPVAPERPDRRPSGPDGFYSNPRYDGGGGNPNNRPQHPPQGPPDQPPMSSANVPGSGLAGGLPNTSDESTPRSDRPPLNVKPRPQSPNEGSYTDFRPASPTDGEPAGPSYPDTPPPQPPANY
ncbi:MAG: Ycf66 family protein [Cyanobacteria bacterium J06642_11]